MDDFDLDLGKAVKEIRRTKAKTVCIQLPDGLKPKAMFIADYIEENTSAKAFIWASSCFGSCDVPELKNIDLLIQWGHAKWKAS